MSQSTGHALALDRVRTLNDLPPRSDGVYVLYWAQMNRRVRFNQALAYAIELGNSLHLPILCYEAVTCSYPHANDRLHTFLLEGVPDSARELERMGVGYAFYLRRRKSDRNDTFYELASQAAAVVTDDYPTFVAARHNASVPLKLGISYHAVDASCVVPMNYFEKREYAAYTIRPKIRRVLDNYLKPVVMPRVRKRYAQPAPPWHLEVTTERIPALVAECGIDHTVAPSSAFRGGSGNASKRLRHFEELRLDRYASEKNNPASHATSNLSAYLHFGHLSSLEVALSVKAYAEEHKLIADEFLEELIVRRELAFNFARFAPSLDSLTVLPDWAGAALKRHAGDPRDPAFTIEQLERAETYDTLWNASQKELLFRGKIHGYYRMYWGKKIIEWSESHLQALHTMIYLHDRYALDGRDPNTYANILWCFGLHDRPFADRQIFGQVRYMSYAGMKRKTDVEAYIAEISQIERTGEDPERL